jgi:broad specificity phosphatase PhoE
MNIKKFIAGKAFLMICAAFISVVIAGCGDDSSNSTPAAPETTTPAVTPTDSTATNPVTDPVTDPATNPSDPSTNPTTTDPITDPATNPTDPVTNPEIPTDTATTPTDPVVNPDPATTVSSFNRDPAAANLAVTPDSTGFFDVGDVYKAVPATSKLVFVMRHAERETSEGQESLLTEKGVEQALSVGAKLAGGDESFYYSSTDFIRTRTTAENIAKGRGETGVEVVTWEGINGGYFLKVPSDTMDAFVRNRGGSWKFISSWAYDDPNPSRFTKDKIPEYLYELMPRGDQFVNEVILANLPNWKRVSVLISHDLLIEPLIAYASNRTVDLKFFESGKWANYLSGIAIVVDEANLVTLLPIRGIDLGYMYTEKHQATLDSLAALQNP